MSVGVVMPDLIHIRDCVILKKGDTYPVTIDETLATQGWRGGQGVQWATSSKDEFLVSPSDGLYAGFMLWGSDEVPDQYTSMTGNQPAYRSATVGAGGWMVATTTYERYTYASRTGGGPLVPITYRESDRLVFSLRGYFTSEDEWSLSGDPRGSNGYYIAFVAKVADTSGYMTVQVSI